MDHCQNASAGERARSAADAAYSRDRRPSTRDARAIAERIERVAADVATRECARALSRLDDPTPAQRDAAEALATALATGLVAPAVATLEHPEADEELLADAVALFADATTAEDS